MSKSFEDAQGLIWARAVPDLVRIELLNHQGLTQDEAIGELRTWVPPGLYQLRIDTGLGISQEFVSVEAGDDPGSPQLVPIEFSSAAPIPGTTQYRWEVAEAASRLSRQPLAVRESGGRLLVFAHNGGYQGWKPSLRSLSLLDDRERPAVDKWAGVRAGPEGWVGWCDDMAPGGYVLRWLAEGDIRPIPVEQSLWIPRGWVTMVFLAAIADRRGTSPRLDPARMTIHQAPIAAGFDLSTREAVVVHQAMELVLAGWHRRRIVLPGGPTALGRFLDERYFNPLLGTAIGHSLCLAEAPDRLPLKTLLDKLETSVPGHPDVVVLAAWLRRRGLVERRRDSTDSPRPPRLSWPPMFDSSSRVAIEMDREKDLLISASSLPGRVSALLLQGSVWTSWTPLVARPAPMASDSNIDRSEFLGQWLPDAIRSIPSLAELVDEIGSGLLQNTGASLWQQFAQTADPVIRCLVHELERRYDFARELGRYGSLRTLTLTSVAQEAGISVTTVTRSIARRLAAEPAQHDRSSAGSGWPPSDGREYIKSDSFGRLVLEVVEPLIRRYPDRDFVDAAAHIFIWLSGKLRKNRSFLNRRRFPTEQDFRAYLRQAAWNAARLAERRRLRSPIGSPWDDQDLWPDPDAGPQASRIDPARLAALHESVETLPYPHKTVLERLFFDNDDVDSVAGALNRTRREVLEIYGQAVDRILLD